jgi:hypothetical protein
VAGATGTGKTVTLMTLAEGFSKLGVPVFMADVKGDVSGLAVPGQRARSCSRAPEIGVADYAPAASPTMFWDLYGKLGHPVRTTVSEMGPTLLAHPRTERHPVRRARHRVQAGRRPRPAAAGLEDLRALLGLVAEERKDISTEYGLVSAQSIAAIQRGLLRLAQDGGEASSASLRWTADIMRPRRRPRRDRHPRRRQLVLKPRLYPPSCCGCCPSCSSSCRKWATWTSPSWCSSSTRRTCCSTTPRRRWCSASSRWCA